MYQDILHLGSVKGRLNEPTASDLDKLDNWIQ